MIKKDNRGITLAEILVVVAIMAIAGAILSWGLNAVSGKPAQQCSQRTIYSMERARVSAMSKLNTYYKIYIDNSTGKVMCEEGISNNTAADAVYTVTTSELGSFRVKVSYIDSSDGSLKTMDRGDSITFKFNAGSGGFSTYPCSKLIFMSGGREYKVKLVRLTGKVYLDLD